MLAADPRSLLVWLFRLALFVALLSAVLTVIYLTPVPELQFASCDRPCHELDWPMICRYRLVLESHHTMGGWCGDCPHNRSDCLRPGCIFGDGTRRKVLTANQHLPGSSIQVCENDILVVDVENRLAGQGVTVHWRGQAQRDSPHMDGVPGLTQCPIPSYSTFQYKFRVQQAGTHLWQAHTGNEMLDGLFGSLIVRKADRVEEARHLYDQDEKSHNLVLSDWGNSILINGLSSDLEDLRATFKVTRGVRYRFRVAAGGGVTGCPYQLHVQDHPLILISLDGRPIAPIRTSRVRLVQGERLDFVLEASNMVKTYAIMVKSNCSSAVGVARLVYNSTGLSESLGLPPQLQAIRTTKLMSTVVDEECRKRPGEVLCISEVKSLKKLPPYLQKGRADLTLYLPFDFVDIASGASTTRKELRPRLNNITFQFPPSPLLGQPEAAAGRDALCESAGLTKCSSQESLSSICECTQLIDIPLDSIVEIVLINQDFISNKSGHVFHLHGGGFHVTSMSWDIPRSSLSQLKSLDEAGSLLTRNLEDPPEKDTIWVPREGAVALRFKASNPAENELIREKIPICSKQVVELGGKFLNEVLFLLTAGYWLLHGESPSEWSQGLAVVLKVGSQEDFPPLPENFPKCGSFIGPDFFLI